MGGLVNSRATTATAWLIVALIIAFNVVLIGGQFTAR
jgi:Mn2+/Fe2+ NRAMP family transporter